MKLESYNAVSAPPPPPPPPARSEEDEPDPLSSFGDFARDHPATTVWAVVLVVVVLKLMWVSHASATTASALISAAGPLVVTVSAVLDSLSILVFYLLIEAGGTLFNYFSSEPRILRYQHLAAIFAFIGGIWFLTPLMVAMLAIPVLAPVTLYLLQRRRLGSNAPRPHHVVNLGSVVAMLLVGLLIGDDMWLPPEQLKSDDTEVIGYVVEEDGRWATLLTEDDRAIVRVETRSISERGLCSLEADDGGGQTLLEMLEGSKRPEYPPCSVEPSADP